jgi:hypothetical protein
MFAMPFEQTTISQQQIIIPTTNVSTTTTTNETTLNNTNVFLTTNWNVRQQQGGINEQFNIPCLNNNVSSDFIVSTTNLPSFSSTNNNINNSPLDKLMKVILYYLF